MQIFVHLYIFFREKVSVLFSKSGKYNGTMNNTICIHGFQSLSYKGSIVIAGVARYSKLKIHNVEMLILWLKSPLFRCTVHKLIEHVFACFQKKGVKRFNWNKSVVRIICNLVDRINIQLYVSEKSVDKSNHELPNSLMLYFVISSHIAGTFFFLSLKYDTLQSPLNNFHLVQQDHWSM